MAGISPINFLKKLFHEKDYGDNNYYYIDSFDDWDIGGGNMSISMNHPILTPAMLFLSKLFAQAEFHIENKKTGEKIFEHNLLDVLNDPNIYQSRADLLQSIMFTKIANGCAVLYKKSPAGFEDEVDSIYTLDYSKIKWPKSFKTKMSFKSKSEDILNQKILYDEDGLNIEIRLGDLIFINDLPNGINSKNFLKVKSRIEGLKQTLTNTNDSLIAKNIILKTNGRDIISSNNNGFPLSPDEKKRAERLANSKYGMGFNKVRTIITKASLTWQSMHIAVRDLGLDESVKTDSNIIFTALHIPKDILSLEAKKTTYNNFKESMVSFVQNQMQSDIKDACDTIAKSFNLDSNLRLVGSYEHLPIMQFILIERYKGIKGKAEALKSLLETGIPKKISLKMCGFDENVKLKKIFNESKKYKKNKQRKNKQIKEINA